MADGRATAGATAVRQSPAGSRSKYVDVPNWIGLRPRHRATWRRWALACALFVLPVIVYWPAIVRRFGFRDDYSVLRESHQEPGKVILVCAMQARPIDGVLMEASFRQLRGIDDLSWLRFGTALLIGLVGAATFLLLRTMKWDRWTAALVAALAMVLPSAQIVAGWAVGWPLFAAMLVALGGFACADRAFDPARRRRMPPQTKSTPGSVAVAAELGRPGGPLVREPRAVGETRVIDLPKKRAKTEARPAAVAPAFGWWLAAVLLVAVSALIYQSNALYYFSLVAAGLWSRRRWRARRGIAWLTRHTVTVLIGLGTAFTATMVAFAAGSVPVSRRVALEHDWWGKLEWFVGEPLQNALGLIVLNHDADPRPTHRMATLVGLVIVAGLCRAGSRGWQRGGWWASAFAALIVASFAVNLAVADRWPAYRVLAPLSVTVLVAVTVALLTLSGRGFARITLLALLVPGVWLARWQTLHLIAEPQATELKLLEAGAARIDPAQHPRVFVLTPKPEDHVAPQVYSDEFGSLSTDSDWVPKEMLKLIMHERFPAMPEVNERYTFASGRELPDNARFDVVIDLRQLRDPAL